LFHFFSSRPRLPRQPRFFWYALVFAGATLISTFFSIDPKLSLKDNRDLFLFLIIPIMTLILNSVKRINWALTVLFLSSVFVSIVGVFITIQRILNQEEAISLDHRLKGFMSHWMTYSGLLMMTFVFFLVYQHYERNGLRKKIILASLVLMTVPIVLTQTRSIWVGIAVSVTLFLLSFNWKRILILIPLVLIVYVLVPKSIQDRVRSIVDVNSPSNRDRIHMVHTAWGMFQDHPITGVGANNVQSAYPQYRHPQAIQDNMHLHNNILQILAERGLIGLIALLLFFTIIAWDLIRAVRKSSSDPGYGGIARASLYAFVSFLVAGFFEYNFGDTEIRFLLLTLITLPFVTAWQTGDPAAPPRP
jgi:O-antigen ligase